MIETSRKRGYSAETIIETATVNTSSSASTTGSSSHVHNGETPKARMKTIVTAKFSTRLNSDVHTTASGMINRGNWVFRTTASWPTIEPTAIIVAS